MPPNPRRAEMVRTAHRLHKEGKSKGEIAEILGIALSTVNKYFGDPTGKIAVRQQTKYYRKRRGLLTKEEAELEFNRTDLPVSDKIRMRPVWRRRQRRVYGQNPLPPPTEEEIQDAIRVLEDDKLREQAPALYYDAFLIFDEASV